MHQAVTMSMYNNISTLRMEQTKLNSYNLIWIFLKVLIIWTKWCHTSDWSTSGTSMKKPACLITHSIHQVQTENWGRRLLLVKEWWGMMKLVKSKDSLKYSTNWAQAKFERLASKNSHRSSHLKVKKTVHLTRDKQPLKSHLKVREDSTVLPLTT